MRKKSRRIQEACKEYSHHTASVLNFDTRCKLPYDSSDFKMNLKSGVFENDYVNMAFN